MTENCDGKYLDIPFITMDVSYLITLSILLNPICKYLEWSFHLELTDTDNYT